MKANALKVITLGIVFSVFGLNSAMADTCGHPKDEGCIKPDDLHITTAEVDIDRNGMSNIDGTIYNTGNINYENVKLHVDYIDEDGKVVQSQSMTLNGSLQDGGARNFILKFDAPDEAVDALYYIECAERG